MTLVVDASVVAAALIDDGPAGRWCEDELRRGDLVAPQLLPVEVTSVLRSTVASGAVSAAEASLALDQLVRLPVQLWPFAPFAGRTWGLRENLSAYDAWYVALAEYVGAPLATLDARLRRAPGPRCRFSAPP